MKKIKMTTSYREFYKPGDVVIEDDKKADELINRGSAVLVETVEEAAPANKMVKTKRKVTPTCTQCGRDFKSERGLKLHTSKTH